MQIREQILEKIQQLPEELLPEVSNFLEKVEQNSEMNAFAKLREIKISAAPDFSTKAEVYPSVEKDGE
jgi:hypothetical protein